MRILIAVKGTEREQFYQQLAALLPWREASQILLLNVIDAEPRSGVEVGRDRYFGRRSLGGGRAEALAKAEDEHARAVLQSAHAALAGAGMTAGRLDDLILRGKPNETIRDLADGEDVDLIVVAAREARPGPHSLGKTVRFLVDHAPHATLVVR
jgi:nucleotide-binding universal stress UspA family protein